MTQRDFLFVFFPFPHISSLCFLTQEARLANGSPQTFAVFQELKSQLVNTNVVVCFALIKNCPLTLKM